MTDYSAYHWSEKARKYAETLGTIFNVKGRVNTVSDLPSTGNKIGDVYLVGLTTDTDLSEYAWLSFDNVTRWEKLGSTATSLAFSALTGSPSDNVALKNALDGKYDASNPNGYTSNVGTVTSVNNTSPDGNGNVTITIPDPLPSQTGQSGKYLTTNGTDASWAVPKTFNLFDFKWEDYLLSDQNWLRADTFSWQDGTVYSNAYNHLVDDYVNGTAQYEIIGSYTIHYMLAPDGHKICWNDQETIVQNIYNESGVAWYYIIDTANQRFKLPRENPNREELIQTVRAKGTGEPHYFNAWNGVDYSSLLPLWGRRNSDNVLYTVGDANAGNANHPVTLSTDSTKSGIISDIADSTSVFKGRKYLYFYVGQFSQSATEQTAGLNAELFNGKADIEALNNKIQPVSTLPVTPTSGVLYVIPE